MGIGISVFFMFNHVGDLFTAVYMTILFSSASMAVIGMEQQENGMCFLMTLPVSRSSYVKEKYFLGILITGITLVTSLLLVSFELLIRHKAPESGLFLSIMTASAASSLLMHAIIIPVQLRFGAEMFRIALLLVIGGAYLLGFAAQYIVDHFHIDVSILLEKISGISPVVISLSTGILMILFLWISFLISLRIMKKKEF